MDSRSLPTLLSEAIRCACQQKIALLIMLLLTLFSHFCYTRGTWVAPVLVYDSMKIFFSSLLLKNLLSTLLIVTPWLLLTQATCCQHSITLLPLMKNSLQVFPKLLAVQVSLWLLLTSLALIGIAMVAIVLVPLLGGTELFSLTSKSTSGVTTVHELLIRIQPPHGCLWSSATLLIPMLPVWYFCCRFLFAFFSVITDPKTGLLVALRHSWQLSASCIAGPLNFDYERYSTEALLPKVSRGIGTLSLLIFQLFCSITHLLCLSSLMGLLSFLPAWGLQMSTLHTNPRANIGITLYTSAIGLFAWIYFFVLYRHQTVQASLLPS